MAAVKRALLATAAISVMTMPVAYAAEAEEDEETEEKKVVIVGSRIKRTDSEGASPVVTFTAEDMKDEGYTSVYEALQSLTQNTGRIQGEQSPNSFTPNAQELNLRGFGAGRTLVLINGRRAADNPTPFNNSSNFFNWRTIPFAMVERIEVLTSGASAIYGSDAVAGVINVILKQDIVDSTIHVEVGSTQGGRDYTIEATTGWANDKTSVSLAAQYKDIEGIRGWDVDYLDSIADRPGIDPDGFYLNRAAVIWNASTAQYVDPGEAACDALGLTRDFRPDLDNSGNNTGYFCGKDDDGEGTLRNPQKQGSISFNLTHQLNNDTELFAYGYYWKQEVKSFPFSQWLQSPTMYDFDPATFGGTYQQYVAQRLYQESEVGWTASTYDENVINISAGARGTINDEYDWEFGVVYSRNQTDIETPRFFEEVFNNAGYYFGDDVHDYGAVFGVSFPVYSWQEYNASVAAGNSRWFYDPADNLDEFLGMKTMDATSDMKGIDYSISGDLFEMEHGPAQFAAVAEFYSQSYDLSPDARSLNLTGQGWYHSGGSSGGGDRDRYSVGVETTFPVTDDLTINLAGRYDKYNDNSRVGGKPTGMISAVYHITDSVMFRANHGTSFRAPDMHWLFAGDSPSYVSVVDPLRCEFDGDCAGDSRNHLSKGDINLKEEAGTNTGFGLVFSPTADFSVTLDYYKIELEDSINSMSISRLLRTEFECVTGALDANSSLCVDTMSRVIRGDTGTIPGQTPDNYGQITQIISSPFNLGRQKQSGYDLSADWKIPTDNMGDFGIRAGWSIKKSDELVNFPGDPKIDVRHSLSYGWARSRGMLSLRWRYQDWGVTMTGTRRGSIGNGSSQTTPTGRIGPWTTWNLTAGYTISDNASIGLLVNNVFDTDAQRDQTLGRYEWPYFDTGYSNAFGRNIRLIAEYRF